MKDFLRMQLTSSRMLLVEHVRLIHGQCGQFFKYLGTYVP